MIAPTSYNLQEEFSSSNNNSSILDNSGVLLSSVYPDLVKGYGHEPMAMLCLEDSSKTNTNCLLFLQRGTEKMLIFDLLAPSKPVITCELKVGSKGWDRIGYLPLTSDTPNEYFAYQAFIEDDQENEKFNNSLSLTKMVGDFKTIDNDLCFASEKGHQQTTFRNLCKLTKADNEPNRTSSSSSTTSSTTTTSTTASPPPKDLKFSFEEGDRKCPNRGLKNGSLFGYDPLSGFINGDALYLLLLDGRIFSLPKVGYVYTGDLMTMTLIDPPSTFWRAWKPANRSVPMPPPRPPTTPPTKEPVTGNSSSKAKSSTTAKSDRLVLYIAGGVLILLLLIALAVLIWYCLAAKSTSGAGEKKSKKKDRDGKSKKKKGGGGETSTSVSASVSASKASASTSKPGGKQGSKVAPSKVTGSSVVASSYAPSKSTSAAASAAAPASSSAIQPKNSSAAASKVKIPSSAKLSKQSSAVGVAGGSSSIAASSVSSAFASKASKAPKLIKGGGGGGGGKSSSMASSSSTGAAVPSRPAASKVNSKK